MLLDRYDVEVSPDHFEYEFFSEGPKGKVKKLVRFDPFETKVGVLFFNLFLGDWNATTLSYDDDVVTNNGDTEKVFATIASIVLAFTKKFPNAFILAQGSTPSRTRKYQMVINKFYNEIVQLFDVWGGLPNHEYQPFKKGVNYVVFLGRKKLY